MKSTFIDLLREAAALLGRYSESDEAGSLKWDGKAYSAVATRKFDPHAAKWSAVLDTIVAMMEGQDTSLSERQRSYLDLLLFGGMGSLNDLVLDEERIGSEAKRANQELRNLTKALFDEFRRI